MKRPAFWIPLAFAALVAGCTPAVEVASTSSSPSTPVATVPVVYSPEAVPVEVAGILSRQAEADLAFKSTGVVGEVTVRAGDTVRQGQVLARLKLNEIEAAVTQARANRDKARRDLDRARQLLATQVYTLEQVQNVETQFEQSEAALRAAEFNAEHAVIEAPADGRILRRTAEPNQMLAAGTPVLGFAADGEGWIVRVGLSDRDVQRVQVGDVVEVTTEGRQTPWNARIARIAEANDPLTRTTEAEIRLGETPDGARSGFVAHARIHPHPESPRPLIPAAAIVEGHGNTAYVFVVKDSVARRVSVVTDAWLGDFVFLKTPLTAGAPLVVVGAEFLRDGMAVRMGDTNFALR